ncbi:hypothetical protein SKC41_19660 [Mycobacterium sp. 050128]|uniref:hypothetical protein n=1 Tax=Mycobacterium sp. 050128 TaxID=3096112 RepID=UPI002EDABCEE
MSDSEKDNAFDPLNDPYPEEFEFLHIGTAINADTNRLLAGAEAFDTQLLEQAGLLDRGPGKSVTDVYGDGSSTESQDAWAWSVSGSLTLKTGIIDASAKFYVQQSLNACRRSSRMKVFGRRINSTAITFKKGTHQQLLDCRTKLFAEKMDYVLKAAEAFNERDLASVSVLIGALADFYDTFGTGYVDELDEAGVGIFEGTLQDTSVLTEDTFGIGGGVSVSLPLVSAGIAADYLKKLRNATAAKKFTVRAAGRPLGCTPLDWAQTQADRFENNGIEKCANPEVWEAVFEKPPVSEVPENAPKDLPSGTGLSKTFLSADMSLAAESVYAREDVTEAVQTDAIRAAISTAIEMIQYERLDPEIQNKYSNRKQALRAEFATLQSQARTAEEINDLAARRLQSNPAALSPGPTARSLLNVDAVYSAGAAVEGARDPSSAYTPRSYVYQPWSYRFPELGDISKMCTPAQVVFGQALVWFSIRAVFAQYLDYCAQYEDMLGPVIAISANQFRYALKNVGDFLTDKLKIDKTKKDLSFVQRLEVKLKQELHIDPHDPNQFPMYQHYEFWIDNYTWLKEIPFGVVAIIEHEGKYVYQENPYPDCPLLSKRDENKTTQTLDIFPLAGELVRRNAYRLYPIISADINGEPYFIWVGEPSRLTGNHDDAVLRFSGLLSFYPQPWEHPSYKPGNTVGDFDETTLPVLIQQSKDGADALAWAENEFPKFFAWPADGQQKLKERWDNRIAMYGINLYPGFDKEDGFGAKFLLQKAGQLAKEASRHGKVLPDITGEYENGWPLLIPKEGTATKAAYSRKHGAMFFWGPGPEGWDLFDQRDIRLVPIDYNAVRNANGVKPGENSPYSVKSGGGPMWMQPRTDELVTKLNELVDDQSR